MALHALSTLTLLLHLPVAWREQLATVSNCFCLLMQSTDPDYAWAVTVIIFYLKLLFGVVGVGLSICWLLQILLYIFVYPPVTPFLNTLFTDLDNAFPLFGTVAFGIFCFYLIGKPSTSLIALLDCMLAM